MRDAGIASGFDFLFRTAGIEVPFVLTELHGAIEQSRAALGRHRQHDADHAGLGRRPRPCSASSIGIARLSRNWLLSTLAGAYVEVVRNIPLLFFVLFWYFGVIAALPGPRQSIGIFGIAFLNNRGLTIPLPNEIAPFGKAALRDPRRARRPDRLRRLGAAPARSHRPATAPVWTASAHCWSSSADRGAHGSRRSRPPGTSRRCAASTIAAASCWCRNSSRCSPRSTTYTAAFIAEIVRGGILAVPQGPARGGGARWACGRARSCASSSSRRRCA